MKITVWIYLLLVLLLTSCTAYFQLTHEVGETEYWDGSDAPSSTEILPTKTVTQSFTPTITITSTATQNITATVSQTVTPTPAPLSIFSSTVINRETTSVSYLQDPCSYLENRWGEGKSAPGTIVVPIMFHSIAKRGREITDFTTISTDYFEYFMRTAKEMGFDTITMDELVGFLEENKQIPERAMILILDDRRPGVTELFMPYLEENDWTLTLGWPTTDRTSETLWTQMETLAGSGRLDIQSHGHDHIYIQSYTPVEEIEEEIYQPIEVIQAHFNTNPVSIIWPGGNFTLQAIQIASEAGLKLGFTVYSRGPLMFNWIPLGEPEIAMENPLFVLPRYWSTAADVALMQAVTISEAAKQDAEAVKLEELRYYSLYCQPAEGE